LKTIIIFLVSAKEKEELKRTLEEAIMPYIASDL
jgi:hypothetical protein